MVEELFPQPPLDLPYQNTSMHKYEYESRTFVKQKQRGT